MEKSNLILPVVSIPAYNGNRNSKFNCVEDTLSQRSYFSESIWKKIKSKNYFVTLNKYNDVLMF